MASKKTNEPDTRAHRRLLKDYEARQALHVRRTKRRRIDSIVGIVGAVVICGLAGLAQWSYSTTGPGAPSPAPSVSASPSSAPQQGQNVGDIPDEALAQGRDWKGTLTLNDVKLGITLDGKDAPQSVSVLIAAIQANYYNGLPCHRAVISATGSLLQCGAKDLDGSDSQDFLYGPIENAPANQTYPAGTIAMARQGNNGYTQGHQFFIVTTGIKLPNDTAGGYSIVGTVTSGLDTLKSEIMSKGEDDANGTGDGHPKVQTKITGFTIA